MKRLLFIVCLLMSTQAAQAVVNTATYKYCPADPPTAAFSGRATYYTLPGPFNCSYPQGAILTRYCAINEEDYNTAATCGACIKAMYGANSTIVRVVDKCPIAGNPLCSPANNHHLDLSSLAFQDLAPLSAGNIAITWQMVECPLVAMNSPTMTYEWKNGSTQWWAEICFRDHLFPLVKVEANIGGTWTNMPRLDFNFWGPGALGTGTQIFRITDARGNVIVTNPLPAPIPGAPAGTNYFMPDETATGGGTPMADTSLQFPGCVVAPPTPTPTYTQTPLPSPTYTFTLTRTPTPTLTRTPTPAPSNTYSPTLTFSLTYTLTRSPTPSLTVSPTPSITLTRTPTSTFTTAITATYTPTPTATLTFTPANTSTYSPTSTLTRSPTQTSTPAASITFSPTSSSTISPTMTFTQASTNTYSPTSTLTRTPTLSFTASPVASATHTPTNSPVVSPTFTATLTRSSTPSSSPTSSLTCTPTLSFTASPIASATNTPTNSPVVSPTFTPTLTRTPTASNTPSVTGTATQSRTPTISFTASPIASATNTPTNSPVVSPTFSKTASPVLTATPSDTPTTQPSNTPQPSQTTSPTRTASPTPTQTQVVVIPTATPSLTQGAVPPVTTGPGDGPNEVEVGLPFPNPNPGIFYLKMKGACDTVRVCIYSRAMAKVAQIEGPGCKGPGWVQLPMSAEGRALSAGGYYFTAEGIKNGSKSPKTFKGKMVMIR